jgi:hypothetical protein
MPTPTLLLRRAAAACTVAALTVALSGCTVLTVAGAAVTAVGVAADVAIGAVKLTGSAVGAAADLVIPDSDDENK